MPHSRANPFVGGETIASLEKKEHLPALKLSTMILKEDSTTTMMTTSTTTTTTTTSTPGHITGSLPSVHAMLGAMSYPCRAQLSSSTNNSLQNLSNNSTDSNLSLSLHSSQSQSNGSQNGKVIYESPPMIKRLLQPDEPPKKPYTPEFIMKTCLDKLTPYEHIEIFTFSEIYYIGMKAKKRPGLIGMPNNNDYDNDQGSYIHTPHDHIAYRYEVFKIIGKGSFGQVVRAYDHKNKQHVALKMVRNEKRFHRQAQEEIRILRNLREQDKDNTMNIIHMFDSFTFRNHMCITFELLSINLYELIKRNKFQGFSLQLVRKFSHHLLQCLDALYKNKIIHCDMKPENVLLKQNGRSGIKVPFSSFNYFSSFLFLQLIQ